MQRLQGAAGETVYSEARILENPKNTNGSFAPSFANCNPKPLGEMPKTFDQDLSTDQNAAFLQWLKEWKSETGNKMNVVLDVPSGLSATYYLTVHVRDVKAFSENTMMILKLPARNLRVATFQKSEQVFFKGLDHNVVLITAPLPKENEAYLHILVQASLPGSDGDGKYHGIEELELPKIIDSNFPHGPFVVEYRGAETSAR